MTLLDLIDEARITRSQIEVLDFGRWTQLPLGELVDPSIKGLDDQEYEAQIREQLCRLGVDMTIRQELAPYATDGECRVRLTGGQHEGSSQYRIA